jgi:hypothetical protein
MLEIPVLVFYRWPLSMHLYHDARGGPKPARTTADGALGAHQDLLKRMRVVVSWRWRLVARWGQGFTVVV